MSIVDRPNVSDFDATPFVTYCNEEDAAPTEKELIEELPEYKLSPTMQAIADGIEIEKPLRRGVGYLRTEISPDGDSTPQGDADDDFGTNINIDETGADIPVPEATETAAGNTGGAPHIQTQNESELNTDNNGNSTPKKRRRRRGRRRRNRDANTVDPTAASQADNDRSTSASAEVSLQSARQGKNEGSSDQQSTEKKRKRRRRRRRNKGAGTSEGLSETPPSTNVD